MKTTQFLLMVLVSMTLAACSGGGGGGGPTDPPGGGGGGGGTTGSATVNGLSTAGASDICVKDNAFILSVVPENAGACTSAGGVWSTNPSVPTGDRCVVGTLTYTMVSPQPSDIEACEAVGGTYNASTNISVDYCDTSGGGYSAPTYPQACSNAGGSMLSLASVSGLIDQTTVALEAGNNVITGEAGLNGLSCALQDGSGNPCDGLTPYETPKIFQTTSYIKVAGTNKWTATIVVATGAGFSNYTGDQNDTPSFSVVLPVKTQNKTITGGFAADLVIETFSLYFQP